MNSAGCSGGAAAAALLTPPIQAEAMKISPMVPAALAIPEVSRSTDWIGDLHLIDDDDLLPGTSLKMLNCWAR
jgi:hypothetical protein